MTLSINSIDRSTAHSTVVIVGAGPAGLFAACELLRHGVRPRVVERRLEPHHEARGTALQPATLDIIDRAGLIEPFLRAGVPIRQVRLLGPDLQPIASTKFAGIGCKYEFQCSLPQWRTETILREHLRSRGVTIEYGTEVKSIESDASGLRLALEAGGRTEHVGAAYVLGAGGARSITRHSMQEHLDGETYDGRYIVADAKIGLSFPAESGNVIVGPNGFVLFSPLPDAHWLIFVNRDEADTSTELPTEAALGALLDARAHTAVGLHDLLWVSYFKMHKRAATRFSDGKRFLLGDAAHLSSPLGGEGLNSAFMDAADIAWKMSLVMRGAAKPSLLDSYAVERGIADHHVLEVSDEAHSSVMDFVGMCRGGGTPAVPPPDAAADMATARRRSMLDVSYTGSALVGHAGRMTDDPVAGFRFAACHHLRGAGHHLVVADGTLGLDKFRDRWDGLVSIVYASQSDGKFSDIVDGVILVRPDGFVGFRADPADATTMDALDAHLASYLIPNTAEGHAHAATPPH